MFWRCAQVSPLTGGERDTQPPKVKATFPENASVNFKGKTIAISFDEFVQVKDLQNQLVITPQTKEMPNVEARGKNIVVKFNEELLPNTTYRIFFGNAIADMHESNILSDYEYVFSTGNVIDSLSIQGKVVNASDAKPQKDVTVALYDINETDSVAFKKKPLYFTKTLEGGNYKLSYLPVSAFKTFAFTDKSKNLMYDPGDEAIAFKNDPVSTTSDTISNFRLFKEEVIKIYLKKALSPFYGLTYIVYNSAQSNAVIPYYDSQKNDIRAIEGVNDTCFVFYHDIFDTLKLKVTHHGRSKMDTLTVAVMSKEKFDRLKKENKHILNLELKPLEGNRAPYFAKPYLQFNNWINGESLDEQKMVLQYMDDSLIKTDVQLRQTGLNTFDIDNVLLPGKDYELVFKKGAFKTHSGIENDSVKIVFKTTEPSDYAVLNLKLLLPKKENYIVQLLNDKDVVIGEQYAEMSLNSSSEQKFKFKNIAPGNYFVKVIEDENQNKKWDTGNVLGKKQPELIYFNLQPIKLMADWDSEAEWKVE